jgi:hypothetical protein
MANEKHLWVRGETMKHIQEIIESNDTLMFEYNNQDYLLESFEDLGWIIVEPYSYFEAGGYPERPPKSYPFSGVAKTPQALIALPFLDGKTMFERFDELRFFAV